MAFINLLFKFYILVMLPVLLTGCKKDIPVKESCYTDVVIDNLEREEGEIKLMGSSWVIEISNSAKAGRYLACNFPEHLKNENLQIIFDAKVYQTPPNLRLAGIPIIITKIH